MKIYLVSIAVGVLVGIIYGLLDVRSPAPPAIALVGLLGMLIGEQVVPMAKRLMQGQTVSAAWVADECLPRITGLSPHAPGQDAPVADSHRRRS